MHHTQKKKFLGMKESGATREEIKAEMVAAQIEAGDIDAFLDETFAEGGEQKPPKQEKGEKIEPERKDSGKAVSPIYEEWKMAVNNENGEPVLEKYKKVKDVKIDHARAARLNEQAQNRRVQYFLKQ